MQPPLEDNITQEEKCATRWKEFFGTNLNALFQIALLLSADPEIAEASLLGAINDIDPSQLPREDELAVVQTAVCKRSIGSESVSEGAITKARTVLQRRLWPILQLESSPRACFVLRMLVGCGISSCAQMLGIEEGRVRGFLRVAVLQLQCAIASDNAALDVEGM